ncbi:1-phosphatidylinositol 4,5-bisphosphate phosphodiesterase epsilon-1-like isoform X4 [Pomacea canaliculata]|uniref:1-phosphatidylinositol 4,5-bisphosphate phosphodiesterase epsilon-1-like isoform X4 n=1 Tax=Pomacea canaliculata TaxID=400727 RepID=UPI000D73B73C|nr:1-phosphatidylinositol 4,5-bisphosphate phosphodiesterase epsilon-1-like isoform X4 [Pomacea canaliculata]
MDELQKLVVSGDLPCSKEEAVTLASIQLHIEEAWPDEDDDDNDDSLSKLSDRHAADDDDEMTKSFHATPHNNRQQIFPTNTHVAEQEPLLMRGRDAERQENLRRKKELIRSNRAQRITSTRRKSSRLARTLLCASDSDWESAGEEVDVTRYLPPLFTASKKMKELIREKQKKLWHSTYYESETQFKQLYIKICKNLPSYGCKLFHVKEVQRGNTQKKIPRLLGISSTNIILLDLKTHAVVKTQKICDIDDWLSPSIKVHDSLMLEFRGTKPWTLMMSSMESLKSVTAAIWEALDMDGRFINNGALRRDSFEFDFNRRQLTIRPELGVTANHSKELDALQKLLAFPEEVAMLMTEQEHTLFLEVPPPNYVRQVTVELSRNYQPQGSRTVEDLIRRFDEVSSWITQLIITQATHEDRKAVLSCILRLAVYCYVLGNFNSVVEILCGLRSEKLKPFWLSISDEDLSTLHTLSDALLTKDPSMEYREAVGRALDIPSTKVVPFFGGFLRELKGIFVGVPSIIVLPSEENQSLEFVSDYNGEDRFMTRIGVGGLINLDKLRQAHIVLNDIHLFHHHGRQHQSSQSKADDKVSRQSSGMGLDKDGSDSDYDLDFDSYQPVRRLYNDHEVMVVTPRLADLDHHYLQCVNHGTTLVHWEVDSGRSCLVYMRLESDNCTLTWCRPSWSSLRGAMSPPDYVLRGEGDHPPSLLLMCGRYSSAAEASCYDGMEEGFLDIFCIKDVFMGDEEVDLNCIARRHSLLDMTHEDNCITILYGANLAENRRLCLVAPSCTAAIWFRSLRQLHTAAVRLRQQTDKRGTWLKQQYLQLYYEGERCQGPTPAEAIKVFGGRTWSSGTTAATTTSDQPSTCKRTPSNFGALKKRMSYNFSSSKQHESTKSGVGGGTGVTAEGQGHYSRSGGGGSGGGGGDGGSGKHKRTPSPLRKMRSDIHKSHASDPSLNNIPRGSPTPGFRPRSLTSASPTATAPTAAACRWAAALATNPPPPSRIPRSCPSWTSWTSSSPSACAAARTSRNSSSRSPSRARASATRMRDLSPTPRRTET